jgi:hypothetical protein
MATARAVVDAGQKALLLGGFSPLTVYGPEPDTKRHRLLSGCTWRSIKFLGRLSARKAVLCKASKFFHIVRGPRTRDSSFLLFRRHHCLEDISSIIALCGVTEVMRLPRGYPWFGAADKFVILVERKRANRSYQSSIQGDAGNGGTVSRYHAQDEGGQYQESTRRIQYATSKCTGWT